MRALDLLVAGIGCGSKALALAALAVPMLAQGEGGTPPARPMPSKVVPTIYDPHTGEVQRNAVPAPRAIDTFCFVSTDTAGFYTVPAEQNAETLIDWGTLGGVCADVSEVVSRFNFAYATTALDPVEAGPGAALTLTFYQGYDGLGVDSGNTPVATFAFTGLPGLSGSTTSSAAFIVDVDLEAGFEFALPNGTFGLGFSSPETSAVADGFANTGPVLCSVPPYPTPDAVTGQVDRVDRWVPDTSGNYVGSIGGTEAAAWRLKLARADISGYPAMVTFRNGGTNPVSYQSTRAIVAEQLDYSVDLTTTGHSFGVVFGFDSPVFFKLGGGQHLLVLDLLGAGELLAQGAGSAPLVSHSIQVPLYISNLGLTLYTQAIHFGGVLPYALSNSLEWTIGGDVELPPVDPPANLSYQPIAPYVFQVSQPIPALNPVLDGDPPFVWQIVPDLPTGLSIDPVSGVITGTPTVTTPMQSYLVLVYNSVTQTQATFDLQVASSVVAPTSILYDDPGPIVLAEGETMTPITPSANGSRPFTWSVDPALPAGLSIDPFTGVISGTATTSTGGPLEVTVRVDNVAGFTTVPVSFTVVAPPSGLAYGIPSALQVGIPLPTLAPSIGGDPVDSWDSSPALPDGISIDGSGNINGTPTTETPTANYTITATNIAGSSEFVLPLTVHPEPPAGLSYTPDLLVEIINIGPHVLTPSSSGGAVDSYAVVGTPLPPGMTLDPVTGVISGTPTELQGSTAHTISASNESGSTNANVTIEVTAPEAPSSLTYSPTSPYGGCAELQAGLGEMGVGLDEVLGAGAPLDGATVARGLKQALEVGTRLDPHLTPSTDTQIDSYSISPSLPTETLIGGGAIVLPRTGVLLPVNPSPIDYTPVEQTLNHRWERVNVWLPGGSAPPEGWPVLLVNVSSGYFGGPPLSQLDPADPIELLFHKAINEGIAVVIAGVIDSGPVGGWFYPPGHPSGKWEDFDELMPEKDVVHSLQWVKTQSLYDLDPNRIFLHGVSAGSTIAGWVSLGPDLRRETGSAQVQASTRVAGILGFDLLFSFTAYADETVIAARHWESTTTPGTNAVDFGDADPTILDENSVARAILDPASMGATTPVFLAYDCPISITNYYNDPDGFPLLKNSIGSNIHDLWNGAKCFERLKYLNPGFHAARSEFYVGNGAEIGLGPLIGTETGTFTGGVLDSAELYDEAVAWMVDRAAENIPHPEGLQLHPKSGRIFGVPKVQSRSTMYSITATNGAGSTMTTIDIVVDP